jgi:hypothetical protein
LLEALDVTTLAAAAALASSVDAAHCDAALDQIFRQLVIAPAVLGVAVHQHQHGSSVARWLGPPLATVEPRAGASLQKPLFSLHAVDIQIC